MAMIKMAARNVDGVDVEEIRRHIHCFWEMPPRSPIAGPDQPRIDQKPPAIALDNHARVPKNAKRNRHAREWYNYTIVASNSRVLRAQRYYRYSAPAFRMGSCFKVTDVGMSAQQLGNCLAESSRADSVNNANRVHLR
jgi:hypothetical protein